MNDVLALLMGEATRPLCDTEIDGRAFWIIVADLLESDEGRPDGCLLPLPRTVVVRMARAYVRMN